MLEIWVLRDPKFPAEKKTKTFANSWVGAYRTCAKFQGLTSKNRREHLFFCVKNMCDLRSYVPGI